MSSTKKFQARYLDELAAAAVMLDSFETPAQAEAWVSGAIAEWQALSGSVDALSPAIAEQSPRVANLISWFLGGDAPTGSDEWLAELGTEQLIRVLELADPSTANEQALIFEYQRNGEPDHDLSVSIVDGALTGIAIGPPGLADGVNDESGTGLVLREVDEETARLMVSRALLAPFDQLSPASEANVPLIMRRMGSAVVSLTRGERTRELPPRDREDDNWCADVVSSALRATLAESAPAAVDDAVSAFAALVEQQDPDALTVLEVCGRAPELAIDRDGLLAAVGAYFAPVDLSAHTDVQFDALIDLEPVDWVGVVLGLTRSPSSGPPVDGDGLVSFINRAPEITSTIPKSDAPRLAWTFDQMLFAWEVTGVFDESGRVSDAGRWLLAQAFVAVMTS